MHIEVVYQGDPTQFGWILPVPEPPTDSEGVPLPLEQAVSVSSQALFGTLQQMTDPRFRVSTTFATDSACNQISGSTATSAADTASSQQDAPSSPTPPVVVLQEAKVGPYDAQLIRAVDADGLYAWLGDNGYLQDPAARPLLDHYVRAGFEFVGIRLQSGKTTGDLRPLAISLGENAPCVPLRLTSIAATPDMPILVWVLGDGRAVPKNFLHARLNDMAFAYPGGGGYQAIVSRAIDTASGRAWVTELSEPTDRYVGLFAPPAGVEAAVEEATTLADFVDLLGTGDADVDAILRELIPMPEGLRGYPYGNCLYCEGCPSPAWCADDADHPTTEAEFYAFLPYWVRRAEAIGLAPVDLDRLRARLEAEVIRPRRAVDGLFRDTRTLTRFFTTIDPAEMTRDPIFAFNPDLPPVSNDHVIDATIRSGEDCQSYVDLVYPDARRWRVTCDFGCPGVIPAVPGQEPLRFAEVLDETGEPVPIGDDQIAAVDRILDGASVGLPTLPPSFEAELPVLQPGPSLPSVGASGGSGCAGGDGPLALGAIGLALTALARRRSTARRDGSSPEASCPS